MIVWCYFIHFSKIVRLFKLAKIEIEIEKWTRYIKIHVSWFSAPSALKGKKKFEILLVKIFSLIQTTNQILPATIEKIKICFFKEIASSFVTTTSNNF